MNSLTWQVAFRSDNSFVLRDDEIAVKSLPILLISWFIHLVWSEKIIRLARLTIKVRGLDLLEWLYNIKVQIGIFFSVLGWWLSEAIFPDQISILGIRYAKV